MANPLDLSLVAKRAKEKRKKVRRRSSLLRVLVASAVDRAAQRGPKLGTIAFCLKLTREIRQTGLCLHFGLTLTAPLLSEAITSRASTDTVGIC